MKKMQFSGLLLGLLAAISSSNYALGDTVNNAAPAGNGAAQAAAAPDTFVAVCGIPDGYGFRYTLDSVGNEWDSQYTNNWSSLTKMPNTAHITTMGCLRGDVDYTYAADQYGNTYIAHGITYQNNWTNFGRPGDHPISAMAATTNAKYVYMGDVLGYVYQAEAANPSAAWQRIKLLPGGITALAIAGGGNSGEPSTVLAATRQSNVWMSDTDGAVWGRIPANGYLPPFTLLASNVGSPYVYSTDGGNRTWTTNLANILGGRERSGWTELPVLVQDSHISAISVTTDNLYVYLGSKSGNTWVRKNDGGTEDWTTLPQLPSKLPVLGIIDTSWVIAEDVAGNTYRRAEGDTSSPWQYIGTPSQAQ